MQLQAKESLPALAERLRYSHPTDDATVVMSLLLAGNTLVEMTGDPTVQFSAQGAEEALAQSYMVYGALARQLRHTNDFWGQLADRVGIEFRPQYLPVVNTEQAIVAITAIDFGTLRAAVSQYDPYMSAIISGQCGGPQDYNERFAAEHGALAVYGILNAYARPYA
jgi:hypothetical protein